MNYYAKIFAINVLKMKEKRSSEMKKAFTMIELTFVIVVAGILSAVMLPRLERDTTYEAALQFASHLRYTQHLAMVDDVYSPTNQNWFKGRWKIDFSTPAYSIYQDSDYGSTGTAPDIDANEVARNPLDQGLLLTGDTTVSTNASPDLNLLSKYNIQSIASTCGTSLAFDHLGRPLINTSAAMTAPYVAANMLTQNCTLTLVGGDENDVNITIRPETGYISID